MKNGAFIISLDFELFWGVLDCEDYLTNLDRFKHTWSVIDNLVNVFEENAIKATWSTVGLLMLDDALKLKQLQDVIIMPTYTNQQLNNYKSFFTLLRTDKYTDAVFFALPLVQKLKASKFQDIGTHTFSHYYCLEDGQTIDQFNGDLKLAKDHAYQNGITLKSIVFPRNQYDEDHLINLKIHDINIFRGNPEQFIYKTRREDGLFIRALHLIDTYFNISGSITHSPPDSNESIYNIKASRFLRPMNYAGRWFKNLQLRRIKNEMTHAAKNNHYYHLWWHPHNFSRFTAENFVVLQEIIEHYKYLNEMYHFSSESMESYVKKVRSDG